MEGEDEEDFTQVGKGGKATQYTAEGIYKSLQAIQEARGKKVSPLLFPSTQHTDISQNTDRADQIRILERLLDVAVTPYQRIRVLLALVSSRFDYNASIASYMPIEMWLSAQREIDGLIGILIEHGGYSVQEITDDYDDLEERTPDGEKDGVVRVRGSIISFVDRLDDEFTRSLQNLDPHGTEYMDRLKDEKSLYCTICRAEALYEKKQLPEPLARVVTRRLEHIYSKVDCLLHISYGMLTYTCISLMLSSPHLNRRSLRRMCPFLFPLPRRQLHLRSFMPCAFTCTRLETRSCAPGRCSVMFTTMPCITTSIPRATCCLCLICRKLSTPWMSALRSYIIVLLYSSAFARSDPDSSRRPNQLCKIYLQLRG